jgi:hypothetical protein
MKVLTLISTGTLKKFFITGEYAYFVKLMQDFIFSDKAFLQPHSPLMTPSEAMPLNDDWGAYLFKTATGLMLLRNLIVGEGRFDYAFKKYTEAWAFKHPTPYDFFHCINNAAGENLNWFWKSWFFTTDSLDQAITDVKISGDSAYITVENKAALTMPVIAEIYQSNSDSATINLPVEIWQRGNTWTFRYIGKSPVRKVVLDPEEILPDVNRSNNEWNAGSK